VENSQNVTVRKVTALKIIVSVIVLAECAPQAATALSAKINLKHRVTRAGKENFYRSQVGMGHPQKNKTFSLIDASCKSYLFIYR